MFDDDDVVVYIGVPNIYIILLMHQCISLDLMNKKIQIFI